QKKYLFFVSTVIHNPFFQLHSLHVIVHGHHRYSVSPTSWRHRVHSLKNSISYKKKSNKAFKETKEGFVD
ncbi:hypothetical protein VIGAN_11212000, partial [Vigna angularis var. angularis]